jgi:hypothetical protein
MLFPTGIRNGQFNLILKKQKNIVFSRTDREHPPVYFGLNGDEIDEIDNHCHLGITFQSSTWNRFCLEELHRRPVIIRPASICTLSNKSDSFVVQLPHTTSPFSKTGLINAKYIRIREIEAGRIITGLRCNSSRQKLFHELGWERLENIRNKHKLILFYKILNGLTLAH